MMKYLKKIMVFALSVLLVSFFGLSVFAAVRVAAPEVKASNIASTGVIKLSWDAVDGAESYKVYRSSTKTGNYSLLKTTTSTSLTHSSVEAGDTYYYYVRSVDAGGNTSKRSNIVSRTGDLARPEITLTNISSTGKIKVSWNSVSGAKEYKVYRAKGTSASYSLVKTTTAKYFTDTTAEAGETYRYKVKAIASNSAANSAYSEVKSRTCDLARPTVTLSNVSSTGKIKVKWDAVSGAKEYKVYRSEGTSSVYTLIKTTKSTSVTNTKTDAGVTYRYKVRAIAANEAANSAYSSVKSRTCDLARPTLSVNTDKSTGKVTLSWNAISGAKSYNVYCSSSASGSYSLLGTTASTSYVNETAEIGTTYYYKVKAISSVSAANSAYSAVKSGASVSAKLSAPVVTASVDENGKPKLTWDPVDGAVEYEVYRTFNPAGNFMLMKTTNGTVYSNSSASNGVTYYYKVRAIAETEALSSDYSEVKEIVVAPSGTEEFVTSYVVPVTIKIYPIPSDSVEATTLSCMTEVEVGDHVSSTSAGTWTRVRYGGTIYYTWIATGDVKFTTEKISTQLSTPVVTAGLNEADRPRLTWNAVNGAVGYEIYRSVNPEAGFVFMKTTTGTVYSNGSASAGVTYYYKVRAISETPELSSEYSEIKVIDVPASVDENFVTSYVLTTTVTIYPIPSDSSPATVIPCMTEVEVGDHVSSTSAGTWTRIRYSGNTYYTWIPTGVQKFTTEKITTKLSAPVVTASLDDSGKPMLTWETIEGALRYEILRAVDPAGNFVSMKTTTGTVYNNETASAGITYYYKVRAIAETEDLSSDYSAVQTVAVPASGDEEFVTSYVLTTNAYIYPIPADSVEPTILMYMEEVEVGDDVSATEDGRWTRVKYKGGTYYTWIPTGIQRFTTTKSSFNYANAENSEYQKAVIDLALQYKDVDTYYTHDQSNGILAPNGKYGFDCSGFVSYVINSVIQDVNPLYKIDKNITTLYETDNLYNKGFNGHYSVENISKENMKPGDVIFFKVDEEDEKAIDHCGIYLGNNEFIHATAFHDGVCIMPLTQSFEEGFRGVRRYYPEVITPSNQKVKTNFGKVYIYAARNDGSERLYTFAQNEEATLLFTSSNDTWGYVRNNDGLEGFVLMKRFDLVAE